MDSSLLLIASLFACLVVVAVAGVLRLEVRSRDLQRAIDHMRNRVQECDARYELLHKSFMKVLIPIRQNTESVDQLDDDLLRLERRIDGIKKAGE